MFRKFVVNGLGLTLGLAALLIGDGATLVAQEHDSRFGRSTLGGAERSDAGDWYGTWYYVSRTQKMAIWIRDDDGTPQVKWRLSGTQSGDLDSFSTDWSSQGVANDRGQSGTFKLTLDTADQNTIAGNWAWEVRAGKNGRKDTANFELYRSGDGRHAVMRITDWKREFWGKREYAQTQEYKVWTFRKASRREAMWNELPF